LTETLPIIENGKSPRENSNTLAENNEIELAG